MTQSLIQKCPLKKDESLLSAPCGFRVEGNGCFQEACCISGFGQCQSHYEEEWEVPITLMVSDMGDTDKAELARQQQGKIRDFVAAASSIWP